MTEQAWTLLRELIEGDVLRHSRMRDARRAPRSPCGFESNAHCRGFRVRGLNPDGVVNIDQHTGASRAVTAAIVSPNEPDTGLMIVAQLNPAWQCLPRLVSESHAFTLSTIGAGQRVPGIRDMLPFGVPLATNRESPALAVGVRFAKLLRLTIFRFDRKHVIKQHLAVSVHRINLDGLDHYLERLAAPGLRERQGRADEILTRKHFAADEPDAKYGAIDINTRNAIRHALFARHGREQHYDQERSSTSSLSHVHTSLYSDRLQRAQSTIRARALFASFLLMAGPSWADHASDNPVLSAADAFGVTIGTEAVGVYDQNLIRGFNPQIAGNARIDGLYFDQQAPLSNRVLEGSTIRVGISALGYPFPAPTGIVDYDLRHAGDKPTLTVVSDLGPFDARGVDLDGQLPIASLNLRMPMGISDRLNAALPGYTQHIVSVGLAPEWMPRDGVAIRAFVDWQRVSGDRVAPLIFMASNDLPSRVPARYLGQDWAAGESLRENFGATLQAQLGRRWTLGAGIFRSVNDSSLSYADLFVSTQQSGEADHDLIGYPDQRAGSTSGEVRLVGHFGGGSRLHDIVFSVRGRNIAALYDGADVHAVGAALIGQGAQIPSPNFMYGPRSRDDDKLWTAGLAYHGRWFGLGELSAGVQKVDYRKTIALPGESAEHRADEPWRLYTVAAVDVSARAHVYAGYTQGIEDSGIAPANAANRGAILPATRTWQRDAGLQYILTPTVKIVAGVFDVHKPYFNLDAENSYVGLGEQQHRGYELSITGEVLKNLNVVAGLEVLRPQVAAGASSSVPIGPLAVGQNDHLAQINVDYRLRCRPAVSLDLSLYSYGRRAANLDNSVTIPSTRTADIGARYRLKVLQAPGTLRLLVQNIANVYSWALSDSGGFSPAPRRSVQLYLTVDF